MEEELEYFSYGFYKFEILVGLDIGFLLENVIDVWFELSRVNVGGFFYRGSLGICLFFFFK